METSSECSSLGPNSSFLSKTLLTKYVSGCSPGDPSKMKSVFSFIWSYSTIYSTSDLCKNICIMEGESTYAIFNEACDFRLFFVLEELLVCPRSLTSHSSLNSSVNGFVRKSHTLMS